MGWDWSDTFKGLIATALGWTGSRAVKKIKPTYQDLKKFLKVSEALDKLDDTVNINYNRIIALYHLHRDPIFICNTQGELTYCNPAWVEMTGFSDEAEAHGLGYVKAIHPDDRQQMAMEREDIIKHPVPFSGKVRFKNLETGETILTHCKTKLVYCEGKLIETFGMLYIIK